MLLRRLKIQRPTRVDVLELAPTDVWCNTCYTHYQTATCVASWKDRITMFTYTACECEG